MLLVSDLSKRAMMVAFLRWRKLKKEQMCVEGEKTKLCLAMDLRYTLEIQVDWISVKLAAWRDESGIQRRVRIGHMILRVIRI